MSPIEGHFGGKGAKIMAAMRKQYGTEKGKRVFYATENKRKKKKPPEDMVGKHMKGR